MQEYTIQRSTRKCNHDSRPFEPNERFYSVVVQKGSELVRKDIGKQHWQGPPQNCVGWWISQMPATRTGKLKPAPTPVLLDALEKLCESPDNAELAYLLALLLMRRRVLTLEEVSVVDSNEGSSVGVDVEEPATISFVHGSDQREFLVGVCHPSQEHAELLQQKLIELLYCDS